MTNLLWDGIFWNVAELWTVRKQRSLKLYNSFRGRKWAIRHIYLINSIRDNFRDEYVLLSRMRFQWLMKKYYSRAYLIIFKDSKWDLNSSSNALWNILNNTILSRGCFSINTWNLCDLCVYVKCCFRIRITFAKILTFIDDFDAFNIFWNPCVHKANRKLCFIKIWDGKYYIMIKYTFWIFFINYLCVCVTCWVSCSRKLYEILQVRL